MESKSLNRVSGRVKSALRSVCDRGSFLAVAVALTLLGAGGAFAEFTPETVEPVMVFDLVTMGEAVLTLMAAALGAIAVYKISVGVGKKVISYFGGRG